jgi:hypothetical protein
MSLLLIWKKKKKLVHVLSIGGSREAGMGVGRSN